MGGGVQGFSSAGRHIVSSRCLRQALYRKFILYIQEMSVQYPCSLEMYHYSCIGDKDIHIKKNIINSTGQSSLSCIVISKLLSSCHHNVYDRYLLVAELQTHHW